MRIAGFNIKFLTYRYHERGSREKKVLSYYLATLILLEVSLYGYVVIIYASRRALLFWSSSDLAQEVIRNRYMFNELIA